MDAAQSEHSALEYLRDPRWKASRLGLERTLELLCRMGNPEQELKLIHITGTNGKGSTAAMLSSMLLAAGYRTGLFTSPYLERVNEEIQINGRSISDDALDQAAAQTRLFADQMEDHPTEFEMLVCTALFYFARQRCDIVVLEVGMGGLRDATNAIPAPEVAVMTAISLDHIGILGETVEEIAAEKAGIIKPGCDVVLAAQLPSVESVVQRVCQQQGCSILVADPEVMLQTPTLSIEGLHFSYRGERLSLPLLGRHQLQNAAAALAAVERLRGRGWKISQDAMRQGLAATIWPGRLERLLERPFFLVDGAHNPQGADTLAKTLSELFPGETFLFLVGVLADKDRREMLSSLLPLAERFITITPDNPRALPAGQLAEELRSLGFAAESCDTIGEGVDRSLALAGPDKRICAFGSLYQAGQIRTAVFSRPPNADG